jgi:hypothetical protein
MSLDVCLEGQLLPAEMPANRSFSGTSFNDAAGAAGRRSSAAASITDAGVNHTADGQHTKDPDEKSPPLSVDLQEGHRADRRACDRRYRIHPPWEYAIPVRASSYCSWLRH